MEFALAKFIFSQWIIDFLMSNEVFVFDWDDGNNHKISTKHGVSIEAN